MITVKVNADAEISGTSFFNCTVCATRAQLESLFGEPCFMESDPDEKVLNEWDFDVDINGKQTVVTLYDWKEYCFHDADTKVYWHIGGRCPEDTNEFKTYLDALLSNH